MALSIALRAGAAAGTLWLLTVTMRPGCSWGRLFAGGGCDQQSRIAYILYLVAAAGVIFLVSIGMHRLRTGWLARKGSAS